MTIANNNSEDSTMSSQGKEIICALMPIYLPSLVTSNYLTNRV